MISDCSERKLDLCNNLPCDIFVEKYPTNFVKAETPDDVVNLINFLLSDKNESDTEFTYILSFQTTCMKGFSSLVTRVLNSKNICFETCVEFFTQGLSVDKKMEFCKTAKRMLEFEILSDYDKIYNWSEDYNCLAIAEEEKLGTTELKDCIFEQGPHIITPSERYFYYTTLNKMGLTNGFGSFNKLNLQSKRSCFGSLESDNEDLCLDCGIKRSWSPFNKWGNAIALNEIEKSPLLRELIDPERFGIEYTTNVLSVKVIKGINLLNKCDLIEIFRMELAEIHMKDGYFLVKELERAVSQKLFGSLMFNLYKLIKKIRKEFEKDQEGSTRVLSIYQCFFDVYGVTMSETCLSRFLSEDVLFKYDRESNSFVVLLPEQEFLLSYWAVMNSFHYLTGSESNSEVPYDQGLFSDLFYFPSTFYRSLSIVSLVQDELYPDFIKCIFSDSNNCDFLTFESCDSFKSRLSILIENTPAMYCMKSLGIHNNSFLPFVRFLYNVRKFPDEYCSNIFLMSWCFFMICQVKYHFVDQFETMSTRLCIMSCLQGSSIKNGFEDHFSQILRMSQNSAISVDVMDNSDIIQVIRSLNGVNNFLSLLVK